MPNRPWPKPAINLVSSFCIIACAILAHWTGRVSPAAWGLSTERTSFLSPSWEAFTSLTGAVLVAGIAGVLVRRAGLGAGLLCLGTALWTRVSGSGDLSAHGISAAVLTGEASVFLNQHLITGMLACVGMVIWLLAVQNAASRHVDAKRPTAISVGFGGRVLLSVVAGLLTTLVCASVGAIGLVTAETGQVIGCLAAGYFFAGLIVRVILPKAGLGAMLLGPVIVSMIAGRFVIQAYENNDALIDAWLSNNRVLQLASATPLQTLTAGLLGLGLAIVLAALLEPGEPQPASSASDPEDTASTPSETASRAADPA